jgi:hypothetical protein
MTSRRASESTGLYTLKQAGQIIGIDPKTLHNWMRDENIAPMPDRQDRRMRVVSEEQLDKLVEVAKRRKHRMAAPRANTPLGGNIRTVNRLADEVRRLQETINAHGEAISRWEDMLSKVKASQIERAVADDVKHTETMKRLEDRVDESLALFAAAAARLESRLDAIEAMKRLEIKVDESLALFAAAAAKLESRLEAVVETGDVETQRAEKPARAEKGHGSQPVKRSRIERSGKISAASPLHARDH